MLALCGVAVVVIALLLTGLVRPRRRVPAGAVSLCLIVRNQAERLEGMTGDLLLLAGLLRSHVADIVVADDGSTDGTGLLLLRLGRRYPGVKILRWPDDTADGRTVLDAACSLCDGAWILLGQARSARATLQASADAGS